MDSVDKCISPKWKTPEEVMKFHRLKRKLNGRMVSKEKNSSFLFSSNSINNEDSLMEFPVAKRRPTLSFSQPLPRRSDESTDESGVEADISSRSSDTAQFFVQSQPVPSNHSSPVSFKNIINQLNITDDSLSSPEAKPIKRIPIDWSLKSKIRFMSTKSFSWSASKRTSEEVSAITGFVRCIDPSKGPAGVCNLDTSPNAQFHQSCLFWQHPHLPWQPLFTKSSTKLSPVMVSAQLQMAETLHSEWTIAFKSLLQLVRMKQCPYFYILGTQFHCLFRAAGIAGQPEINTLISPTTRGFRKMMEDEDITYSMPLRNRRTHSLDINIAPNEDDDDDVEEWMESAQARKLTSAQRVRDRQRESRLDGSDDSLVMVTGVDVQALFNLLVNCKNNHDRLPPTLISPTAFQLATLRSCQVRDALVMVDGNQLHSVQIEGPVMPHALSRMCHMLREAQGECSAAVATVKPTIPFTTVGQEASPQSHSKSLFFLQENLSDCGLGDAILQRLCESDPSQFGVIESIEPDHII